MIGSERIKTRRRLMEDSKGKAAKKESGMKKPRKGKKRIRIDIKC